MPNYDAGRLSHERAREIAEECYGEVLSYCRRHAPSGHEATDLAQETFLRFVRAGSYRESGKPISYLMRIARSVCVDASRKKRLETVPLDFEIAEEDTGDIGFCVEEALSALPEDLREAVELRYGSDLAVTEVARTLGISRFAARRRINSALKALEHELGKGGFDDQKRTNDG